jgi:hypothetical protein
MYMDKLVPVYASIEDGKAGVTYKSYPPEDVFITCEIMTALEGVEYCMLQRGGWVEFYRFERLHIPLFMGVELVEQPPSDFAWVVVWDIEAWAGPGITFPKTGNHWGLYDLVYIYESVEVDGWTWYRVSDSDWITAANLSVVHLEAWRNDAPRGSRWIEVDLFEQVLTVRDEGRLVFATLVSTGRKHMETNEGLFEIRTQDLYSLMEGDPSIGAYHLEQVPRTMYYDGSIAIHGAYWQTSYGYPRTHGCVNLSVVDSDWVFQWAELGTQVLVYRSDQ